MALMVGLAFVVGLQVGSFLNVCIRRWPLGQSVVRPGSLCPGCSAPIAWRDKLPVVSFVALRRRCRACREPISWRYPLVEILTAAVFASIAAHFGTGPDAFKQAVFASMMLVLVFTDIDHRILPDKVTLTGIAMGIAISPLVALPPGPAGMLIGLWGPGIPAWGVSLIEALLAAAVFGGCLWVVGEAYYRVRGREGLGLGDVKLIALIAAFQGSAATALVLIIGSWLATLGGILAITLYGKDRDHPIPLGSYLAGTALVMIFVAEPILDLYWSLILG